MAASMGESLSRISNDSSQKELSIASIFKVAQTEAEAKDEWKAVGEAMAILEASNLDLKRGSVDNVCCCCCSCRRCCSWCDCDRSTLSGL